jgi:hypothetical protein
VSLGNIVRALGGDLYDGGRRASIPAPGHSPADRSVSLLLRDDRVVVHTFGDGDWREVLDDLRARGLIDDRNAPTALAVALSPRSSPPAATDVERRDAARRFWDGGRAVPDTLSERHCRLRRIRRALPGPDVARHCSATPVSAYAESKHQRPALLVAICDGDGAFTAVEVTYLKANGQRAGGMRLPRKTIGLLPANTSIRIDTAAAEMVVGEGFFTTLSATERFQLPGWALMSTRNLRTWIPPEGVRSVLIAGDRGTDGEASAALLAARLREHGVRARVAFPAKPHGDWNDWAQAQNESAGRAEALRPAAAR